VPVVVAPDRYLAGRLAELHLGATVHVLDDGFQHMVLARDVDLVIVDAADVDRPRLLPGGRLREPLAAARHAHAIVVTEDGSDARAIADRLGVSDAFSLIRTVGTPVEQTGTGAAPLARPGRVLLVSGIARPARFEQDARAQGLDVAGTLAFRDHHIFGRGDIDRISATLREMAAEIVVTTEKDLMRLLIHRPWPFRVAVLPLSVAVEPAHEFASWLTGRLARARARERPMT
jgi:tetraacyldisaccharide 4'-kinase